MLQASIAGHLAHLNLLELRAGPQQEEGGQQEERQQEQKGQQEHGHRQQQQVVVEGEEEGQQEQEDQDGEDEGAAEAQLSCSVCGKLLPATAFSPKQVDHCCISVTAPSPCHRYQARRPAAKRKCTICIDAFSATGGAGYWGAYHAAHPEMLPGTAEASHHAAMLRKAEREEAGGGGGGEGGVENEAAELASDDAVVYIEFGAGSAYLSSMLQRLSSRTTRHILLDRAMPSSARRQKRCDKGMERTMRVKCDIRHLDLNGIPELARCACAVAVSKHLCGAATDLALRACVRATSAGSHRITGVAFALCCHTVCSWDVYVNQAFMLEHGLGSEEFEVTSRMNH